MTTVTATTTTLSTTTTGLQSFSAQNRTTGKLVCFVATGGNQVGRAELETLQPFLERYITRCNESQFLSLTNKLVIKVSDTGASYTLKDPTEADKISFLALRDFFQKKIGDALVVPQYLGSKYPGFTTDTWIRHRPLSFYSVGEEIIVKYETFIKSNDFAAAMKTLAQLEKSDIFLKSRDDFKSKET